MTTPTPKTSDAGEGVSWRGSMIAAALVLVVVPAAELAVFGELHWSSTGQALALLAGYGALGVIFSRQALRGGVAGTLAWGIGGKFARSFVFVFVTAVMILTEVVEPQPFMLALGIGWLICLVNDVSSIYRSKRTVSQSLNPPSYVTH